MLRVKLYSLLLSFVTFFLPSLSLYALSEEGYKKLHVFTTTLHYIEENYVEETDEKELLEGAIRGMMSTLDPHSVYMAPEIYRELKVDTRGRFDGIGIEVAIRDGMLTVVAPIKGSPAEQKGMKAGDRILKIDVEATKNLPFMEAVRKMRGKRGSTVALTLERPDTKERYDVSLVRQLINVPSVKAELLEDRFGYFNISSFQQGTAKKLHKFIEQYSKKKPLEGIILDLRRNPGGLLEEGVAVSDLFLKQGVIVTTESRGVEIDRREAKNDGDEPVTPLIVLIDAGSASASEIVAGALQDHKRAVLLGMQSFGKGSVQTVVDLDDGSGLKLTVARYFTPNRKPIQAHGITPDIIVPAKITESEKKRAQVREKDLSGHLKGEGEDVLTAEQPATDYQKHMAIHHLKSWGLFQDTGSK